MWCRLCLKVFERILLFFYHKPSSLKRSSSWYSWVNVRACWRVPHSHAYFWLQMLGESKVLAMNESKEFKKGIHQLEWEKRRMIMQMEDLQSRARYIQMLKLTKNIQAVSCGWQMACATSYSVRKIKISCWKVFSNVIFSHRFDIFYDLLCLKNICFLYSILSARFICLWMSFRYTQNNWKFLHTLNECAHV